MNRATNGRTMGPGPGAINSSPWETLGLIAIGSVLALSSAFWAGAHLAARLAGDGPFAAGLADAALAIWQLPSTASDPAAAWPPEHQAALPGAVTYYLCLGLVVAGAAGMALFFHRAWRAVGGGSPLLGVEPNAGLATPRQLRTLAIRKSTTGRLTLGHVGGRLVAAEPQASLAVVGPSGCGKSVGFAIPALLEWEGPVIATSVKPDLVHATLARRRELGKVWIYDPAGCTNEDTSQWSPLNACGTWAGAMRMAAWLCEATEAKRSVTDADYWQLQGQKALAPHLYAAALGGFTIRDVVRWVDGQDEEPVRGVLRRHGGVDEQTAHALDSDEARERRRQIEPRIRAEVLESVRFVLRAESGKRAELADQRVTSWPIDMQEQLEERIAIEVDRRLHQIVEEQVVEAIRNDGELDALVAAESLWAREERLKGSVYASVQNMLLGYADPTVAAAGERCDVDLDAWLSGPNTVYVVATADEQSRLRPVFTTLVQQAVRRAYATANGHGGTLAHPCLVLLDEAGNIAPLKDLPTYAATARSHGITMVTVWQDLAQIRAIYGHQASTVLNNHRAKIFGNGIADGDTLDYVSRLVGDHRYTERNFSSDLGGGPRRSVSEHTSYRRALPMDVIRRMPENEGLLLYGSELPAHLHLRPWYRDRRLDALAHPGGGPWRP
jgi:type IV secretion system protein VirD4